MTGHVYRNFFGYTDSIQSLIKDNPVFEEVCTDYEELCTWIDSHLRTDELPQEELHQARELKRELEEEIKRYIEANQ